MFMHMPFMFMAAMGYMALLASYAPKGEEAAKREEPAKEAVEDCGENAADDDFQAAEMQDSTNDSDVQADETASDEVEDDSFSATEEVVVDQADSDADEEPEPSEEPDDEPEEEPSEEPEEELEDEPQSSSQTTCWITKSGRSYHYSRDCRTLSRSKNVIETTVEEATSKGYEPCDFCR